VLEVLEPGELVEPFHGLPGRHGLSLLEQGEVRPEVDALQHSEHCVAESLGVLCGVKGRVERHTAPGEVTPQLQELLSHGRVDERHGPEDEVLARPLIWGKVEVAGFVGEDVDPPHAVER
jgi:hypothetical protein